MLKILHYITLALIFSTPSLAKEMTRVTLDNGAEIAINDDFTWQYVILETAEKSVSDNAEAPIVAPQQKLTPLAIEQSALIATNVAEGVRVTYKSGVWDDNELGLTFSLKNTSQFNAVIVKIEATFFDDAGVKITSKTLKVWQAQYRLPETYLRKGESKDSQTIWLEAFKPEQWKKQLISLKVIDVETR